MIERQILSEKMRKQQIEEFIFQYLNRASYSHTEIQKTPLGEKIIIYTSRPGLVVGRKGSNIQDLTKLLKKNFNLENPQIEVAEIDNPSLNALSVAKRIVSSFEKFGPKRFKSIGYKVLEDIINAGALGAEIVISGRGLPSVRAKSWRFKAGYLKKSGDVSMNKVNKAYAVALLRSGAIGVKISILKPDVQLPDKVTLKEQPIEVEAVKEGIKDIEKEIKENIQKFEKELKKETVEEKEIETELKKVEKEIETVEKKIKKEVKKKDKK